MVDYLVNELDKRLEIEDMKEINWEKTRELQALPKFVNFHKWLKEHEVKYDSIEYPVAFGKNGDLLGIAAKRPIGPEEAYLYVPNKIIINEDKVWASDIAFIIKRHSDVFDEHADAEYLRLIFFMTYELSKGEKSLWYPYFQIAQEADLPCFWTPEELSFLEDELLKAEVMEYKEEYEAEYQALYEIASMYPTVIDIKFFTPEFYKLAFTITVTRCFGWSLPHTSVVPFADCANHFIIDNQYELYSKRLHDQKKFQVKDSSVKFTPDQEKYFTNLKMRINYEKHFSEDKDFEPHYEVPYKTMRYIRKLTMRDTCSQLKVENFLEDPEYKDLQIWDLKYISTSDEEDNDSSEGESGSSSESDEEKKPVSEVEEAKKVQEDDNKQDEDGNVDPKKIWKLSPGKNENVPQIAQKLRPAKKKQRIYYAYTYDNKTGESGQAEPQKVKVIKKRVERRQPENLIDILVMQKQYLYDKEQRMKILKEQDEEEWSKMTEEYNSSEEEDDEENFAWYNHEDNQTYFVLCTKHKNIYKAGQQVFHCYGRRTNRFLLLNYGFCLNNNKYNSLSFRVWVNFNWQEDRRKDEEQKKAAAD